MKKLCCLIITTFFPMLLLGQDYAPFPYDSVFFESSVPNSDLMPVVKHPTYPNAFETVNVKPNLSKIAKGINWVYDVNYYMQGRHWMGFDIKVQDVLYFYTGIYTSDDDYYSGPIPIDLNKNMLEKDTISFFEPLRHFGDTFYLEIQYDSLIENMIDTIKQYSFQVLDSNYLPIDLELGYNLDTLHYNINNQIFQISKNNGILKSPDFAYFPSTAQYTFKGKIKDILNIETDHFHKVFDLEVGDEIHTRTFGSADIGRTFNRYSRKIVCTDQEFDSTNNAYYTNYDIWTRYDKSVFSYITMTADSGFVYSQFEEIIDTVYLDDYEDLNVKIPNGFGSTNDYNSRGFFYRDESETLIYFEEYVFIFVSDGYIEMVPIADGGQEMDYYPFGLAHKFWDNRTVWGEAYSKPIYVSTTDTTWGTPYSDDFLDLVENSSVEVVFFIQENKIILPANHEYQDFRIYDITGKLMDYYLSSSISEAIDISKYTHGTYILIGYDGTSAKYFKFIR